MGVRGAVRVRTHALDGETGLEGSPQGTRRGQWREQFAGRVKSPHEDLAGEGTTCPDQGQLSLCALPGLTVSLCLPPRPRGPPEYALLSEPAGSQCVSEEAIEVPLLWDGLTPAAGRNFLTHSQRGGPEGDQDQNLAARLGLPC